MRRFAGLLVWCLLLTGSLVLAKPQGEHDYPEYPEYDEEGAPDEEIVVNEDAPQFQSQSRTITVVEGDKVEFNCKTVAPTQDLLLLMRKSPGSSGEAVIFVGNMKVLSDTRFLRREDGIFGLDNARRLNAGTYSCVYQTKPPVVLEYVLDVQYSPSIKLTTAPEQRVPKGDSLTMACEARGNPEPEISWSKVGGKMPSGELMESGLSITLENVDRHVEGTYQCTATNNIGKPAARDSTVFVEYPPEIMTEKAIIRTGEGDKVELVCIVHARPVALVTWTKDGNEINQKGEELQETEGGHRHTITISHVTEEHFGSYECRAENDKGEDFAIINLTDLPKMPHFTSESTSAKETEYTLTWVTESYYPIREYNLKYRVAKVNETSDEPGPWVEEPVQLSDEDVASDGLNHKMNHTLAGLKPATDYQARVTVKNEFKWGAEATFEFSTRKETVSPHTTAGSDFVSFTFAVLLASIFVSLSS